MAHFLQSLRCGLLSLLITFVSVIPVQAGAVNDWLEAARTGKQDRLITLLPQVGINAKDPNGNTALIFAVREGHHRVVQWLLEKGAEVDLARKGEDTWEGWTALMFAAAQGNETAIHALLEHGANVNAQDVAGTSPLMLAACQRPGLVRFLLEKGANPNLARNGKLKDMRQGWTATMYAVNCKNHNAVEALVAAGADVWAMSADHYFMSSGGHGDDNLLAINLASAGSDTAHFLLMHMLTGEKKQQENGDFLLALSLNFSDQEALKTLLSRGAPPQGYPNKWGNTSLHIAVMNQSSPALIQILMEALKQKGLPLDPQNKAKQTPRDLWGETCAPGRLKSPENGLEWAYNLDQLRRWCHETGILFKPKTSML